MVEEEKEEMEEKELPTVTIQLKDAKKLKEGLVDINEKPLPNEGVVIKKVTHASEEPKVEYIVPEGGEFLNYINKKLDAVDMEDFVKEIEKELK